ncbi:hypothetical protein K1T71_014843 [Dendrolimus kikuchii]|nr:hypothetical protein K1T71_014843 [Dendrolimus kikuchii]
MLSLPTALDMLLFPNLPHIEIIPIKPYLDNIENAITSVEIFCNKIQENYAVNMDCKDNINPLEILMNANYLKFSSLSHLITENGPIKSKRAIEFGGEILKFFFGTLDADDARKYDEAISDCQQNEHQLYSLMKDNIHVVKSTINNFNISIRKLNDNEDRLNKHIEKLNYILTRNTKENSLNNAVKINSIFNIIESSIISVSNILDTILNSILFAITNILHPYILTPTNLYNELSKSKISKGNLEFPVSLSLGNIHYIIDSSTLISYVYNNKIFFVIKIPLITPIKFNMYKILPLPTSRDVNNFKTYVLIQPNNLYMSITDDRLNYALSDNIDDCKNVNQKFSICPLPSILSTIKNPSCETKLLTEVNLEIPEICNFKIIYGNVDLWQKLKDGRYIYVQSKASRLTINCEQNIKDFTIQGTGILTLNKNCVAYFQNLQFYPTITYESVLPNQLSINFNILQDCEKYKLLNKSIELLTPISISNINLENLNLASHKLDKLENEINQSEKYSHILKYGNYYSITTYIILAFIFFYVFYKIYSKCFRNCVKKDSCCIQIFNQCYNKKTHKSNLDINTSIELTEISDESVECDKNSFRSLPEIEINKNKNKIIHRNFIQRNSNRNLSNF